MRRFSAFLLVFCMFFCDCGGVQHQQDQQPELIPDEQAMNAQQQAESQRQVQLKKQQEEQEKRLTRVRELIEGDHVLKKDVMVCNELPVAPGRYLFKKTRNICQIRPDRRSLLIHASHFYRIIEQIEDERERKRTQSFFSRTLEEQQLMPREDQPRAMFRIKVNGKNSP